MISLVTCECTNSLRVEAIVLKKLGVGGDLLLVSQGIGKAVILNGGYEMQSLWLWDNLHVQENNWTIAKIFNIDSFDLDLSTLKHIAADLKEVLKENWC